MSSIAPGRKMRQSTVAWHMNCIFLIGTLLLLQMFGPKSHVAVAQATSLTVYTVEQDDLNGDGTADVTVIDCAFATDRDRVLVFDRKGDMPWGTEWQEVTDFRDDVWVFDVGADDTAQLIVVFDVVGDQYVATIYDDIDGDGQVSYHLEGTQIVIEESDFSYVKLETSRYWTQYDVLPQAKMTMLLDGGLPSVRTDSRFAEHVKQDGVVDWVYETADKDEDGVNDYQLVYTVNPVLRSNAYVGQKAAILVQDGNVQPTPYVDTVFWPMLKGKHASGNYQYFDHPPVVTVDWETGTIDALGTLGFPIEAGYHIYSRMPLTKDTTNVLNWENPIAYYDMANNQNGWGELAVRFDVIVPYDPIRRTSLCREDCNAFCGSELCVGSKQRQARGLQDEPGRQLSCRPGG